MSFLGKPESAGAISGGRSFGLSLAARGPFELRLSRTAVRLGMEAGGFQPPSTPSSAGSR